MRHLSMASMRRLLLLLCLVGLGAGYTTTNSSAPSSATGGSGSTARSVGTRGTVPSSDPAKADAIMKIVRQSMTDLHLKAVIVRATIDGKEIVTEALGESMTGVPATPDMHFRNGAVAISYVSTLLLVLVDKKQVSLDDKVSKWLPDIKYSRPGDARPARPDDLGLRGLRPEP